MKQLGEMIVSKNLTKQTNELNRLACRGIIYQNDKLLMIYSKFYNDYTFPGGGAENGEDEVLALERECREEAGVIIHNVRPFFKTIEKREIDEESYLLHESHFYLCDIKEFCEKALCDYEVDLGYETRWLTVDEAIFFDEKKKALLKDSDYDGVLERELRILYELKKVIEV